MADTLLLTKGRTYALLLVMETLAAVVILTGIIPVYQKLIAAPGHPLSKLPQSPMLLTAALLLFQCVYWYRVLRVPVAVRRHSLLLSHLVYFLGRLSFVFGTALFVVIMLRHLPALDSQALPGMPVLILRGIGVMLCLFSLHCYANEMERLAIALEPPMRHDPKTHR